MGIGRIKLGRHQQERWFRSNSRTVRCDAALVSALCALRTSSICAPTRIVGEAHARLLINQRGRGFRGREQVRCDPVSAVCSLQQNGAIIKDRVSREHCQERRRRRALAGTDSPKTPTISPGAI